MMWSLIADVLRRLEYTTELSLTLIFGSTLIHMANLEIASNKLSSTRKMCQDLVLEETPCLSMPIIDHLP